MSPAGSLTATAPTTPAPESLIAYTFQSSIRLVASDGSDDRFLADGTSPSWSPDGRWLAHTCRPADALAHGRLGDICVVAVDGNGRRVLIRDGIAPRWSPAGDRIAFARSPIDLGDTWIARADGSGVVGLQGGTPTWSPDGGWLMVLTGSGSPIVNVVRPDGSDFRELGPGGNATWSPDGGRIACSWCGGGGCQVAAIDLADGNRAELFTTTRPVSTLLWPPGELVAYGIEEGNLEVFDLETGKARALTDSLVVRGPLVASPAGDRIAFAGAPRGGEFSDVYVASLAGGWIPLTRNGGSSEPAWQPAPP